MSRDSHVISHMRAITISREYGSGGGEIASRLASYLSWKLIDHEIVVRAALKLDIPEAEAETYDEHSEGIVGRILTSMRSISSATGCRFPRSPYIPGFLTSMRPISSATPDGFVPPMIGTDPQVYHETISKVITGAVTVGHVVVVGRGAQVLFANRRDVLHVRIVAPLQLRTAYVMQREGLDLKAARSRIQLKENSRHRYLQAQYRRNPDDAQLYDLVVNTGVLSLSHAVALIAQALEYKAERLATAVGDLGPETGLQPYPSQPGDFRLPDWGP